MNDDVVFCKSKNIVHRVIGDETVLVPILKTNKEMNCIFTLNKPAAFVWNMFDGKTSLAKIKKKIIKDFDTDEEEVERELQKLVADLKEAKAIC